MIITQSESQRYITGHLEVNEKELKPPIVENEQYKALKFIIMNNQTQTTNRLHFEDLDWRHFEQLSYEILYREKKWKKLDPIGLKGNDNGVDILGIDKEETTWYIQCKNYKAFAKTDAKEVIDKIVAKQEMVEDSMLLIMVACEVSSVTQEYIKSYSKKKGFRGYDVWTGMRIETLLFDKYCDLLSRYLGIETETNRIKEKVLQRNKIRQEIQKKLLREIEWTPETRMDIIKHPFKQFRYSKVVLRSVDDIDNPYGERASFYKICPYNLNDVGIELLDCPWVDFRIAINIDTRSWRRIEENEELRENEFDIRTEHVVLVPYYCIVDIREEGGDVDDYPVILCEFKYNQSPFLRRYYKHAKTKIDFKKEQPVDYSCLVQLLDEAEKNYTDGIN